MTLEFAEKKVAIASGVLAAPNSGKLNALAIDILKHGDPSDSDISAMKELMAQFEQRSSKAVLLEYAEKILGSLKVGRDGLVDLTIPAGISDITAMKALNVYFRENHPNFKRGAIWESDLDWYAEQKGVVGRDITKERKIRINPLVDGTLGSSRERKGEILKEKGMGFAPPEEEALVVAAYACKNNGEDLLKGLWALTAASGVALSTNRDGGVGVGRHDDDYVLSYVGAGGALLPSN